LDEPAQVKEDKRHSLEDLVEKAEKRRLSAHFKKRDSTTVRESVQYHLSHFIKDGIVRMSTTLGSGANTRYKVRRERRSPACAVLAFPFAIGSRYTGWQCFVGFHREERLPSSLNTSPSMLPLAMYPHWGFIKMVRLQIAVDDIREE
jgi:hypothetical protein